MKTRLKIILRDVKAQIEADKAAMPLAELKAMIRDVPPLRSFSDALKQSFGLIAEIKKMSPSAGSMRSENVRDAISSYESSPLVHAVSVLTNSHFGMLIRDLLAAKKESSKPILRKDFILDEYQLYQARAFGADAVLLMGNIGVKKQQLHRLWQVAKELDLDVLFESHTRAEIKNIPADAKIYGINCRLMDSKEDESSSGWKNFSRFLFKMAHTDTDFDRFNMIRDLPRDAIKVAESGVSSKDVKNVRARGFDAVLVGTSLLTAPEGIHSALRKFEEALEVADSKSDSRLLSPATA